MTTREIGRLPEATLTFSRDEDEDWQLDDVHVGDCENPEETIDVWRREVGEFGVEFFLDEDELIAKTARIQIRGQLIYIEHNSIDCGVDYDAEFERVS